MRRGCPWKIVAIAAAIACAVILPGCAGQGGGGWDSIDSVVEVDDYDLWEDMTRLAASGNDGPAPAVYLSCDAETWFTYEGGNFTTTEKRRVRIAVLDAKRAEGLANIRIPFSGRSSVDDVKAQTTLKDGTVHQVRSRDIHERSGYAQYALYADHKEKVFAMPALADSCILEYSFVRTESGVRLEDIFEFQRALPVRRATYTYAFPNAFMTEGGMTLSTSGSDALGPPKRDRMLAAGQELSTLTWSRENLPARVSEPLMPGSSETGARIIVYPSYDRILGTITWKVIGDEYFDVIIGELVRPSDDLAAQARDWSRGASDDAERIELIGNAVSEHIRYVSIPLAGEGWEPQPPLETLGNSYGDCKDMSVLSVALLRSIGIEAHPVVLRTRGAGALNVTSLATSQLNHMIVHARAGSSDYWFDPTAGAFRLGELPWEDRGVHALLVSEGSSALVMLPKATPQENVVTTAAALGVDRSGALTGSVTLEYTGEFALMLRSVEEKALQGDMARMLEAELQGICAGAELLEWDVVCSSSSSSCTATLTFESGSCVQTTGDMLICDGSLFCAPFPVGEELEEPRHHDVVLERACVFRQSIELLIPDGWSVQSIPEYVSMDCPHGAVTRAVSLSETGAVHATSEILLRSVRVPAGEIGVLVELSEVAAEARRAAVVLKRDSQ